MPRLSVIVPLYNAEKYILQCLTSILKQSFQDIEVIVVDDGSTDQSRSICEKLAAEDKRISLVCQENQGPFRSRYAGLKRCTSEYVTFVDADDFIAERSFELGLEDMEKGIDVISFDILRFFAQDHYRLDQNSYKDGIYDAEEIEKLIFPTMIWDVKRNCCGLDPALWNKIYKKALAEEQYRSMKACNYQYGEDVAVVYPMMLRANSLSVHHEAYYYHRQRPAGELAPYLKDSCFLDKLYLLYQDLKEAFSERTKLQKQAEFFYMHSVMLNGRKYGLYRHAPDKVFPFDKVLKDQRIVLYGAGNIGRLYKAQLSSVDYCTLALWVDQRFEAYEDEVKNPDEIVKTEYDKIVIAIDGEKIRETVKHKLMDMGVAEADII